MKILQLISLCDLLVGATDLSHWQVGIKSVGSAKFFRDIKNGSRKGCNLNTYDRAIDWFSANWPAGLEWPADIPRPTTKEDAA